MKPNEFISFKEKNPEPNKYLIVTNDIDAKDTHGEMSHVWLTNFLSKGLYEWEGIVTLDDADRKIIKLTHWKYA